MFSFVARHSITKSIRSPPFCTRRAIYTSPPRRGGVFRNADGKWSASIDKIGTFTIREILVILGGFFTIYVLCKAKDAEKKCQEFEARARGFLVRGIAERRKAVMIMMAVKECLRQKEEKGEPFDEKEARLKAETLAVLERQEKFLNDLDSGEPVEIAPGIRLRKR